ncbi:MAG: S-layer homology domain-containing protein [Clostridia bacterium]|nr:S-layer homology domain-containing protein [Clostridia bacterium]
MKKLLSIILCVILTVGMMSEAFAADSEDMKRALETVKSRIGNTDEYDSFESGSHYYEGEEQQFNFDWQNTETGACLYVTALADGTILRYSYYDDSEKSVPISQMLTKDEYRVSAENFVKQINPDIFDDIKLGSPFVNSRREVSFDVTLCKNGYPIKNTGGMIEIDLTGKKLLNFYLHGINNENKYETGDVISKEEAVKIFKEKLGAELYYSVDYELDDNKEEKRTISPKYRTVGEDKYISALTGETVSCSYDYAIPLYKEESAYSAASDYAGNGFSEAEIDEIENIEKLISPEKAFNTVMNIKCADLPDAKFEDVFKSLIKLGYGEKRQYSFRYSDNSEKDGFYRGFYASVDAESGEITNFNAYSYSESDGKASEISDEDAAKTADNALRELAPKKYGEYKLQNTENGNCLYQRYVNDIPVDIDTVSISVNPDTKKVTNYHISYTDETFPSVENVITKDETEEILLSNADYEICYIYDGESEGYKLCYSFLNGAGIVDAKTGEYEGFTVSELEDYGDVSGHYAEGAANALLQADIGFAGGELKPDEPIKQKEFAALVQRVIQDNYKAVIGDDYDYDSLYDYIDFIAPDEADPDGAVTRRDAAKFTVRAMGYIDVAKLDIFKPIFNDMAEDVGYASILAGLKILNGDGNGNFNPEGVLTRSQALIIIYNYLNR